MLVNYGSVSELPANRLCVLRGQKSVNTEGAATLRSAPSGAELRVLRVKA